MKERDDYSFFLSSGLTLNLPHEASSIVESSVHCSSVFICSKLHPCALVPGNKYPQHSSQGAAAVA